MYAGLIVVLGTWIIRTREIKLRWNTATSSRRRADINFIRSWYTLKSDAFEPLLQLLAVQLMTMESIVDIRLVILALGLCSRLIVSLIQRRLFLVFMQHTLCINWGCNYSSSCTTVFLLWDLWVHMLNSSSRASLRLDIRSPLWPLRRVIFNIIRTT